MPIEVHLRPRLRAAVDRIVPRDYEPGALDLKADEFIESLPEYADRYNLGLAKLPDNFDLSSPEMQDSALADLEAADPAFFELLRTQTIEGCLAFPSPLWDSMGFVVTA